VYICEVTRFRCACIVRGLCGSLEISDFTDESHNFSVKEFHRRSELLLKAFFNTVSFFCGGKLKNVKGYPFLKSVNYTAKKVLVQPFSRRSMPENDQWQPFDQRFGFFSCWKKAIFKSWRLNGRFLLMFGRWQVAAASLADKD